MQAFDEQPHLQLLKEMLTHMFATPKRHSKSKPFHDHVVTFSIADNRVWLRNYQVCAGIPEPPRVVHLASLRAPVPLHQQKHAALLPQVHDSSRSDS